jgi:hypothetical protein
VPTKPAEDGAEELAAAKKVDIDAVEGARLATGRNTPTVPDAGAVAVGSPEQVAATDTPHLPLFPCVRAPRLPVPSHFCPCVRATRWKPAARLFRERVCLQAPTGNQLITYVKVQTSEDQGW